MPDIQIRITNLPEIKRAFGMAPTLMKRNLNSAIKKSVFMVERESKILTPVDTGRLRASHRTLVTDLRGEVGTHTDYDIFVHEGTYRMRSRPYLRTAVNKTDPMIQNFMRGAVQDTLETIGKAT